MSDFETPLDRDLEHLGQVAPLHPERAAALRQDLLAEIETGGQAVGGSPGGSPLSNRRRYQSWFLVAAALVVLFGAIGVVGNSLRNRDAVTVDSISPAVAPDNDDQKGEGKGDAAKTEEDAAPRPTDVVREQPATAIAPEPTPTVPAPTSTPTPEPELETIAQDPETIGFPVAALAPDGPPSDRQDWVPWGPEVTGGVGVVPFELSVQVPDGGGETIAIADSYRGISGLRPGDTEFYNIATGTFVLEMKQDSGWPEPEINCVGATTVQVDGFIATLTVGAGDNIRCEFIARKGATSLAITDVRYQCGIGFTAVVAGEAAPFYVTFSGESIPSANGSFAMPDFGTFVVDEAGPFLAPAELLDFTQFDAGPHPINVAIEDSAGGRVPVLEAAAAYISEQCTGPVSVDLFDAVAFGFGEDNIQGAGVPILRRIASILIQDNVDGITIIGHTDSIGDTAANQQLSETRAQAIADYLVRQGVPAENLTIGGRGETEPRADNENSDGTDNPDGRQQNRRVEISWRLDS